MKMLLHSLCPLRQQGICNISIDSGKQTTAWSLIPKQSKHGNCHVRSLINNIVDLLLCISICTPNHNHHCPVIHKWVVHTCCPFSITDNNMAYIKRTTTLMWLMSKNRSAIQHNLMCKRLCSVKGMYVLCKQTHAIAWSMHKRSCW